MEFQSYQSKQFNPDAEDTIYIVSLIFLFQSYQSRQINPDATPVGVSLTGLPRFNRINLDRSVPNLADENWLDVAMSRFQSYQSKQINPDKNNSRETADSFTEVSIVSIQTDQSRLGGSYIFCDEQK